MEQKAQMKLLTVEDAFFIEGRGLLVMPLIPEYSGPTSFPVVLKKPSGEQLVVQAHLDIPRLNPRPKHFSFSCLLDGVSKQDVPIGTEIWISDEKAV
jgi:hypothetical protein